MNMQPQNRNSRFAATIVGALLCGGALIAPASTHASTSGSYLWDNPDGTDSFGTVVLDEACEPGLKEAAEETAQNTAEKMSNIMTQIIGAPLNIEELACLNNMFSMDFGLDINIPGIDDIMDSILSSACAAAEDAWGELNNRLSQSLDVSTDDFLLPTGGRIPGFSASANGGIDRNPNASLSDFINGEGTDRIIDMDINGTDVLDEETYGNNGAQTDLLRELLP